MSNKTKSFNYILYVLFLLIFLINLKNSLSLSFQKERINEEIASSFAYHFKYPTYTPTPKKTQTGKYKLKSSPTPTPTPIERVIDIQIFDPQWMRLELLYARSPQSPFHFFNLTKSERTMSNLYKCIRRIMYEEVQNTYCAPFLTAGSFYDTRTGKSIGKLISKNAVLTNGVEKNKGYNLIWDKGRVYIWSNKELKTFFKKYNRWPYTSVGGLAIVVPYYEKREIREKESIYRTCYGLRSDGTVILMQYEGTIKGLSKAMVYWGSVKAVQVDSGSQGICLMKRWAPYYQGGRMKSLIIGIPSFHLYKVYAPVRG